MLASKGMQSCPIDDAPNFSAERMAAGGTSLHIRALAGRRHRSPLRSAALSIMRIYALILVSALAMIGCATEHYTTGRGDVGQFILQQAIRYGGGPTTTNGLPAVISGWRYLEDEHGMQIHLPQHEYSRIEGFLNRAFAGKPQFGPSGSAESRTRIHEYRISQKGGGIQLSEQESDTLVLVIRPFGASR
jgi:hypothetical protein